MEEWWFVPAVYLGVALVVWLWDRGKKGGSGGEGTVVVVGTVEVVATVVVETVVVVGVGVENRAPKASPRNSQRQTSKALDTGQ